MATRRPGKTCGARWSGPSPTRPSWKRPSTRRSAGLSPPTRAPPPRGAASGRGRVGTTRRATKCSGSASASSPASPTMTDARRIVVGITGATGAIYGIRLLELLRGFPEVESHLVISGPGKRTIVAETESTVAEVEALAHRHYDDKDIGAALASGSFRTDGMVIAPCSIKTASAVAHCHTDTPLSPAAGVTLM